MCLKCNTYPFASNDNRYNKFIKEHVRNPLHPEINLANTTSQSATVHYFNLKEEDDLYDLPNELYHRFVSHL